MGCAGSKDSVSEGFYDVQESAESRALNEHLEKQQREESAIVKLLVLGTGESGKSTVFKQMKILYSVPDPNSKFSMVVRANLFGNAQSVHLGMQKLSIAYATPHGRAAAELISSKPADGNIDPDPELLLKAFASMYADAGVKEAIERASEFQLNDSTDYFWARYAEILKPDYLPTDQDVLRARVRTTGIVQQNFQIKDKKYTMFDVGGQRNERRKWIHCFDNVTAVIFVTAISEFDQVLYEDENTNRMDEALNLFEQILAHPSFHNTSVILFLNKRDIFTAKLARKDMSCWDPACDAGQDYDKAVEYIKHKFLSKNAFPERRQIYAHATCATDTQNISVIMEAVFDIVLKENLRKMDTVDVDKMMPTTAPTAISRGVKYPPSYLQNTILLCSCQFTDSLKERSVLVLRDNIGFLPAVEVQSGRIKQDSAEFLWLMGLGKNLPVLTPAPPEAGSFQGNFKEAAKKLREVVGTSDLGFIYDEPIYLEASQLTLVICVRHETSPAPPPDSRLLVWKEHEAFENEHYKKYLGKDTDANPCKAPDKNSEFDPFAANPVGFRWFKGVTLNTAQVNRTPTKGVYLGILRVVPTPSGFKVMVNEHNRLMIPYIFISSSQLSAEELTWLQGVRVRWSRGIKLLQGATPNRGWLGPDVAGEEGATLAEKLWWAIDEAKARLGSDSLGELYDFEAIDVDENNNMQLILFASLARDEKDLLEGHVWVDRQFLEVQNMKHLCPTVLDNLLKEQGKLVDDYQAISNNEADADMETVGRKREEKARLKQDIESNVKATVPIKWLNRIILWCADKRPSFADAVPQKESLAVDELVGAAIAANKSIAATRYQRELLLSKYKQ